MTEVRTYTVTISRSVPGLNDLPSADEVQMALEERLAYHSNLDVTVTAVA